MITYFITHTLLGLWLKACEIKTVQITEAFLCSSPSILTGCYTIYTPADVTVLLSMWASELYRLHPTITNNEEGGSLSFHLTFHNIMKSVIQSVTDGQIKKMERRKNISKHLRWPGEQNSCFSCEVLKGQKMNDWKVINITWCHRF